jgi:hypothetical protein
VSVTAPAPVREGQAAPFTVTVVPTPTETLTVDYATVAGYAHGTPAPNADFQSAVGSLTFLAGQATKTVSVGTVDSGTSCEGLENFSLSLSKPVGMRIETGSAESGILDYWGDCATAGLEFENMKILETLQSAAVKVTRADATSSLTIGWTTVEGSATAGTDFTAASGNLTFAAGEASKTITIAVKDSTSCEPDEVFSVRISANGGSPVKDGAAAVIIDDIDC